VEEQVLTGTRVELKKGRCLVHRFVVLKSIVHYTDGWCGLWSDKPSCWLSRWGTR